MSNIREVVCTVIEGNSNSELKSKISEFTDMDVDFIDDFPASRKFTHFQIEDGGIEYMSLLDEDGNVIWNGTIVLCVCGPVECSRKSA